MSEELEVGESLEVVNDVEMLDAKPESGEVGDSTEVMTGDSAAPIEAEQEEKPQVSDGVQKVINAKHRKMKEAEEKAEALQKRIDEIEASKAQAQTEIADVPTLPDAFDDNYEAQLANRESVIRQNAKAEALREIRQNQEQSRLQSEQQAQQEAFNAKLTTFAENGEKVGLSIEAMTGNRETIQNLGVNDAIVLNLFSLSDGPQVMDYLAKNPDTALDFAGKSQLEAGIMISDIRSKVTPSAPKLTKAPPPPHTATGAAAQPAESPLLKGATFD
tara:strand:- start:671 stop:1492 length:822 start_codon:yes stop_codon:yes gene_type:complete